MSELLSEVQKKQFAATGANWQVNDEGRSVSIALEFPGFAQAWHVMNEIAVVAEKMNHHPEWKNIYNKVWIDLTTHDAGGLTGLDLSLAQQIDAIVTAARR